MHAFNDLDERLDKLGHELAGRPSFVDEVMNDLTRKSLRLPHRRWFGAAGVIALAASVLIALTWFSSSQSVYAQAIVALHKVKTIHVTGWTSRPVRKWPLEGPQKEAPARKLPVDAWYWDGEGRRPRCYERFGPVTVIRDGAELREYQSDVDLLFISKGFPKDYVERLSSLAPMLETLRKEGAAAEDLGPRSEKGRTIRGLKFARRGASEEYWFDTETNLPTSYRRKPSDKNEQAIEFELRFAYEEQVPAAVASYRPPEAKRVRYGGNHDDVQIVWRQHVQELGRQMQNEAEAVVVIGRNGGQAYSLQYTMQTPDEKHWVVPLDLDQHRPLSVRDFIRLRVATAEGDRAIETWRVPTELLEIDFPRADLVCGKDVPWQQWVAIALKRVGLEFVDVVEERTYWIAEHDGRKLKPYQQVKPPVPYVVRGGKEQKWLVKPGVGHRLRPVTMLELISDFNRLQNDDLGARHPILVDETGLPREPQWDSSKYATWDEYRKAVDYDQYLVASDSPYFAGEESRAMARDWYRDELGVTFREEQRQLTIHLVRRKQ